MKRIPYARQSIDESDIQAVSETLGRELLTQGPQVVAFEEALKRYLNVGEVVVVANGTAALHLSYLALNLEEATVFTTPITFAATANMLQAVGAEVRFVDVHPQTGLMDVQSLEAELKVAPRRGRVAIVPVSLQGIPADLPAIQALARQYHGVVVEDAAHSLGAEYTWDQRVYRSASCAHSDLATLSFHPLKSICCGEGGAVTTHDSRLAEKLRALRNHGLIRQDNSYLRTQVCWGFNYRMSDLLAALGVSQLKRLPFFLNRRRTLANRYHEHLAVAPYRDFLTATPRVPGNAYHLFVVHFETTQLRDKIYTFLQQRGIETQVHYPPLYKLDLYRRWLGDQTLPGAEAYYRGCLSIPLYTELSEEDQDYVLESLAKCCQAME